MKGTTLIGMPGSGKSTIGVLLAKELNVRFLDLDAYIRERTGKYPDAIVKEEGEQELMHLEEVYTLELSFENVVFSPGGSIIYSAPAMEKLRNETTIVYLDLPLKEIEERLGNTTYARGIIGIREKSLRKLFEERTPLYRKCAHHTILTSGLSTEEIINKIRRHATL